MVEPFIFICYNVVIFYCFSELGQKESIIHELQKARLNREIEILKAELASSSGHLLNNDVIIIGIVTGVICFILVIALSFYCGYIFGLYKLNFLNKKNSEITANKSKSITIVEDNR